MTILLAGHETTASTLSWAWYLLSRHPEAAERMHDEAVAALGDRTPEYADLTSLPYTAMVIQETMRLYPRSGRCRGGPWPRTRSAGTGYRPARTS
ncbi:hypothetical protein Psuf_070670 [Phytohabitans suffuscus]|uniref:Cytochrome P450 n=1 Tax=Phytohabitans suffuscus TaxID=624315 RepID=A0A6F8YUH8_9ACTN|nr:hypothetical protein Psuf_070670 [Phytohabitans suffuscus]